MSHLTLAVSENAFQKLFPGLRDKLTFSKSDSGDFGRFTAGYSAACHLEGGTLDFQDNGTVKISELDLKWDTLQVRLAIDIPEVCVGGHCLIPTPPHYYQRRQSQRGFADEALNKTD